MVLSRSSGWTLTGDILALLLSHSVRFMPRFCRRLLVAIDVFDSQLTLNHWADRVPHESVVMLL